ncbi:MAG: uracil-DNA glycosylase [Hamadaea sp.]|uniref:uracil-DNA glycosylase n=1 Tax=Hamadaea sp. NPDC050747 TaxID=3155789 RepID=UPI0017AC8B75|nr:uracil-DNA glycosylase [Streptomyces sp.]NUR48172.1 uracil-DNA glycosylase [Hamadaea sp.]NUR73516.1 uracil-DNA glycosylase [Hamadaea sp.]NUT06951.1 uracil-DNA glycosylase [Hamadaea sp.]
MGLDLVELLPGEWRDVMKPHLDLEATARLSSFVESEYATQTVYPPIDDLFAAFRLCAPAQTRVLILGQDPYHKRGQAHGLSFSVRPGVSVPPSLRNVYKEIQEDLGVTPPPNGDLTRWAQQGVLLLNAVLTVREGKPTSHADQGWEAFTDAAIKAVNESPYRVVYLLWGSYARKKAALVRNPNHVVIEAGHPSPMNPRGFLGSRPFSQANAALQAAGRGEVNWGA